MVGFDAVVAYFACAKFVTVKFVSSHLFKAYYLGDGFNKNPYSMTSRTRSLIETELIALRDIVSVSLSL